MRSQNRKRFAVVLAIVMMSMLAVSAAVAEHEKEVVVGTFHSDWVVLTDEVPEEPGELPEETLACVVTRNPNGYVNLRAEPSIESEVLTKLQNGTMVVVLGQEGEWLNVRQNALTGYIREDFIEASAFEPERPERSDLSKAQVRIWMDIDDGTQFGDTVSVCCAVDHLYGWEYSLQWQRKDADGKWTNVPGANGLSHSFTLTESNLATNWRVQVDVIVPEGFEMP